MDPNRFRKLIDVVGDAMQKPTGERRAVLEDRFRDDTELLAEALELLSQAEATGVAQATEDLERRVAAAAELARSHDGGAPKRIGAYTVVGVLGRGGMGVVYEARQEAPIRRDVAIKVLPEGLWSDRVLARFEAERQTLALMDHPHIARIYDAGTTENGRPYFVMERVHGSPITVYCDEHRLSGAERLQLFTDVCGAVEHAHRKGIAHRDLKPSNVIVANVDGRAVPKVIDFGIAKATDDLAVGEGQTREGELVGTIEYMSPEQARMTGGDVDTRTDVYSLGVILYELIVGRHPFAGYQLSDTPLIEAQRVLLERPPRRPSDNGEWPEEALQAVAAARSTDPKALGRWIKGDLEWVILRALEKEPARRYQYVRDLAAEIERFQMNRPVEAGPPGIGYRTRKLVQRHRVGVIAGAVVVLSLVAGATTAVVGLVRATRAQRVAEREVQRSEQINAFLTGMLESVRPENEGDDVTVREILDVARKRLNDGETIDDPLIEASLLFTLADSYRSLGDYDDALPLFERALEIRRAELRPDAGPVLVATERIGMVAWLKGDLEEALARSQEVLAIRERTAGKMNAEYAAALTNVANTYADMGEYGKAEVMLREVMAIEQVVLSEDEGASYSYTLNNLGAVLSDQGRFEEAIEFLQEALALRREYMGDPGAGVARTLTNLGYAQNGAGRYEEAERTLRLAVSMCDDLYGPDHPRSASARVNLAAVLRNTDRLEEAEALLRASVDVFSDHSGPASWRVGRAKMELGSVLLKAAKRAQAESELTAAWNLLSGSLGPHHRFSRAAARNLSALYERSQQTAKASVWRDRSLANE